MSAASVLLLAFAAVVGGGVGLWALCVRVVSVIRPSGRHRPRPRPALTGLMRLVCDTSTCGGPTVHVVLPCGAAQCAQCGAETAYLTS